MGFICIQDLDERNDKQKLRYKKNRWHNKRNLSKALEWIKNQKQTSFATGSKAFHIYVKCFG